METPGVSAFDHVDAVIFDIDGTLIHAKDPSGAKGARPIPGAIEAVERVRASGRPILFFTNGTGRPPARAAADLRSVGFALADEEYMNPAVVAAGWIARKHPGRSVLVLGGEGVVAPLRERGISVMKAADARIADVVLVGWDDTLTYGELRAACDSVWAGAPLLATSTASVFSVDGGPAPGWSGAVVAGIRHTTGARAVTLGKPSPVALREMCRVLGVPPTRTAVVGDDLDLEIAMARRLGSPTALVLSGISSDTDARASRHTPTVILPDVSSFPALLSSDWSPRPDS
jgi:4-nitrophenyl phosphatase